MAFVTSSFSGTEGPPLSEGGVWSTLSAYWQRVVKANGLKVDSAVLGNDCAARYTGVTFSADHFAEITLAATPTPVVQLFFQYVMCRMNSTAACYLVTTAPDVSTSTIQVYKLDNAGTYSQIGADITLGSPMAAGDVMRLSCTGTTLTVRYNGALVRTVTDTTLSTGQPGVGGWAQNVASNVVLVSLWSAGDNAGIDDAPTVQSLPVSQRQLQPGAPPVEDLPGSVVATIVDEDAALGLRPTPLLAQPMRAQDLDELSASTPTIVDDSAETALQASQMSSALTLGGAGEDLPGASVIDEGIAPIARPGTFSAQPSRAVAADEFAQFVPTGSTTVFPLRVSSSGRYLEQADGSSFLLCADTTWSLFVDIPLAGVSSYFSTLVSQGFNAVMGNAIEHHYSVVKPPKERGGLLPFSQRMDGATYTGSPNGTSGAAGTQGQFSSDNYSSPSTQSPDCTFINNSYWLVVEQILDAALASGLAVLVWPGYLGFHANDEGWMNEMVVWDAVTGAGGFTGQPWANASKSKMWNYGAWMANRWKDYPHIVWVMGGDYGSNAQTLNTAQAAAVSSLMEGLKSVAGQASVLFCAHWDRPALSTDTTIAAGSFDINGCYADEAVAELARRGYASTPVKPTIGLEYYYEDDLFGGSAPFRKYVYWQFLGGVAGGFYGHEQLWRFDDGTPGTDYATLLTTTARLDAVRQFSLWKSLPWHRLKPSGLGGMGTLVTAGGGTASPQSTTYVAAAATSSGDLLLAYIPPDHTGSITVDMTKMVAAARARWFDPTDGSFTSIGTIANTGTHAFTPPATNNGGDTDFLLVLDISDAPLDEEPPRSIVTGSLASSRPLGKTVADDEIASTTITIVDEDGPARSVAALVAVAPRGVEDESPLQAIVDDDQDPPIPPLADWPIPRASVDDGIPAAVPVQLDDGDRQRLSAVALVAASTARAIADDDIPSQVIEDEPWTFAIAWPTAPLLVGVGIDEFPGIAPPDPVFGLDEDQIGAVLPLAWPPAAPQPVPSFDDLAIEPVVVDPIAVLEDAIWTWVHTGSGLAADHVIWSDRGPIPAGTYIELRLKGSKRVSSDWLLSERTNDNRIIHHARGTRNPTLELTCFAGATVGSNRCEAILDRVLTSYSLPTVAAVLKAGQVGVGTIGPIRTVDGMRGQMFDPRAIVEVTLHTMTDVSEEGHSIERVSAAVQTQGGTIPAVVDEP